MITNTDRALDHLPSLERWISITGTAPVAPPRRDIIGNLTRSQRAKARAVAPATAAEPARPAARPAPALAPPGVRGCGRRKLTETEVRAVAQVAALPSETARRAGYVDLADRFDVPLRTIQIRGWWIRQEKAPDA